MQLLVLDLRVKAQQYISCSNVPFRGQEAYALNLSYPWVKLNYPSRNVTHNSRVLSFPSLYSFLIDILLELPYEPFLCRLTYPI